MAPRSAFARTFVLLAVVLDVPVLARLVSRLTTEPRVETLDIDGVPTELVLPAAEGRWPAFHFVNGAHPERRQEPIVRRVTHGLARAGFVVALPDLPGLGEGELTPRTFDAARAVTQMLVERPEVRDGRVALAGVSAGAGIALVTAGGSLARRPHLGGRRRRPVRGHRAAGVSLDDLALRAGRGGAPVRGHRAHASGGRAVARRGAAGGRRPDRPARPPATRRIRTTSTPFAAWPSRDVSSGLMRAVSYRSSSTRSTTASPSCSRPCRRASRRGCARCRPERMPPRFAPGSKGSHRPTTRTSRFRRRRRSSGSFPTEGSR